MEQSRPPLTQRLTRRHLVALDTIAAGFVVVLVSPTPHGLAERGLPVALFVLVEIALGGAVLLRRLFPVPAFGLGCAGYATLAAHGYAKSPLLALIFLVYTVGLTQPPRRSAALIASAAVLVGLGPLLTETDVSAWSYLTGWLPAEIGPLVAFWVIGVTVAKQRAYHAGLREQAERRVRAQAEQARRTLIEERLRIAREMHDVVAHSMSVIAVQAGVGHHVSATRPDEAAKALATIETTSRSALRELRGLLGVLREEQPPADERAGFHAAPGLAELSALVEKTGRAGLQVAVRVDGTPRELPSGMDRAAYRIIQEALTNVVKHAATGRGEVAIHYGERDIRIEITDDGIGPVADPPETAGGHGLVGMRERVALYDGEFQAGPRRQGGFRVLARLPLGAGG
ncbi:sensor histidine kinase [Embleya sp. AB8]|uniref:sensor histidine kinase n=1 Tax=Embleya sp. AB8 TaxID=3156304 RepID=UPI003C713A44